MCVKINADVDERAIEFSWIVKTTPTCQHLIQNNCKLKQAPHSIAYSHTSLNACTIFVLHKLMALFWPDASQPSPRLCAERSRELLPKKMERLWWHLVRIKLCGVLHDSRSFGKTHSCACCTARLYTTGQAIEPEPRSFCTWLQVCEVGCATERECHRHRHRHPVYNAG